MYKVEKIRVNNFKNIIDTELELDNMNVIVGPNNSGKSNFLQVIPFLKHIIRDDLSEIGSEFKLLYRIDEYFPASKINGEDTATSFTTSFDIEFLNVITQLRGIYELQLKVEKNQPLTSTVYDYNVTINKEGLWYKNVNSTGPYRKIFERSNQQFEFAEGIPLYKIAGNSIPRYASVLRFLNLISFDKNSEDQFKDILNGINEILNSPTFYFSSFELRKNIEDNPQSFQNKRTIWLDLNNEIELLLMNEDKKRSLEDALKQIIGIENLTLEHWNSKGTIRSQGYIVFEHDTRLKEIDELSDGSLLLIAFIVEVLSSKNDIIFIEEPENSIHPKALEELIKFMQEFDDKKQFIITTHSSALLNIIKDPSKIIIADVSEEGYSTLRKPKDIKALRKKLSKGFLSLGDLLYFNIDQYPEDKENATTY